MTDSAPATVRGRRWPRLRVALIVLALMLAVQILAVGTEALRRARDTGAALRFPLPAQAAAIVELLEATPDADRPRALRALNSPDVRVALLDGRFDPHPGPDRRLPPVERAVARYIAALGERPVAVYLAESADARGPEVRFDAAGFFSRDPLRMDIGLATGGIVRIETRGDLARRVFGWPLGLGVGIIGLLLALLAAWEIWRETRPLPALAARLDRFSAAPGAQPMDEDGPEAVRKVIAAFNRMQARIAELMRTRGTMIAGLGHDLRTYLTRLRLRAELISDPIQRGKAERDLTAIGRILEDALAYAALDAADRQPAPLALDPLIAAALEGFPETAPPPASGLTVLADGVGLPRVLANVFGNAAKYAGAFEVSVAVEPGETGRDAAVVLCADRGPGWPPGDRERLLRPFERGEPARDLSRPGTGLGLAIADEILRASGGFLRLVDREDGGAVVEIVIPTA